MFSASEVFDIAIQLEENGERFYREAVKQAGDERLKERFKWLAEQEMRHRELFVEMKRAFAHNPEDRWAEEASGAILQSAMGAHGFSLDDVDFNSIPDEMTLLKVAISFEEDGIMFYELIGSFVKDSPTQLQLNQIIQEERSHIALFEERMKELVAVHAGSEP